MSFHFHVCEECFCVWGHDDQKPTACFPHDCPLCDAGPFLVGYSSRRGAEEEKIKLKAAKAASP